MASLTLSQLRLSEAWGQEKGDQLCGPLALFGLLKMRKAPTLVSRGSDFKVYKDFLNKHFPQPLQGMHLEDGFANLYPAFAKELGKYKIVNLNRKPRQKNLATDWNRTFKQATKGARPFILQIGVYHASIKGRANVWQRGLGHFLVVKKIAAMAGSRDPYFSIEYWDPWDGREHHAIVYEEVYRDFTALDFRFRDRNLHTGTRRSPSGHQVLSPNLCLLAPHLDLYDPKVYFAQRSVYLLERALL